MRVIGILGGMGPAATVELFRRIVLKTPAHCDQDHIPVLIDSNPKIPDRGSFLLAGGPDPRPALCRSARKLERLGASFLVMPCNTAHAFLPSLREAVHIPFIDMIAETARAIRESRVGLLATETTIRTRLYHDACAAYGIEVITPFSDDQARVMEIIYAIKGGACGFTRELQAIAARLRERGARALVVGCTELSLVVPQGDFAGPVYDALDILAEAAVRQALHPHLRLARDAPQAAARP
ncbi:Aspartate racemase [bacterium HR07]|uniref:Aspartate racemase n=1 Tax=Acetithermum autotrophicum TaxID=1446466 RepID=H5SRI3_ACEAU|nr:aspartate racemase [Candidatus Acetothermum autotrophicum]GBC75911.1 Aspartate racemase [bacterium HR07]